jgi:aldehyde:ferredoxin oxidoreductase
MEWIIRVNTRTGKITKVKASQEEMHWGGRLLISKVLLREVPPTADPLGRFNKLIVAPGLLGDTIVTTTGKFSVGGKSPLTHGVKESDVGGEAGKKIARLGIKAVVLEEIPEKAVTKVLTVTANQLTLSEFPELKGKQVSETIQILRKQFGSQVGIICIGPAGEMKMAGAGVAVSDVNDIQVRYAARGGLGAVMGSKGIKAIVVDDSAAVSPHVFDEALLREARPLLKPSWRTPRRKTDISSEPLRSSWSPMNLAFSLRGTSVRAGLKKQKRSLENGSQR